jgi:hypothetical protein
MVTLLVLSGKLINCGKLLLSMGTRETSPPRLVSTVQYYTAETTMPGLHLVH